MQDHEERSTARTISHIVSFERCVLELIANSLNAHAAAIAVRLHAGKREIQVVDNGVGIPKDMLQRIAEYDSEATDDQQRIHEPSESNCLADIRRLSDRLTIASRYQCSRETFMKEFDAGLASSLQQIEQRPSRGTTVSIYGFHEVPPLKKWDTSTICCLTAAIAVAKLKVSFSIRDEDRKKVVLRIAKPHSPVDVLRTLFGKDMPLNRVWSIKCSPEFSGNYHGYVGLSEKNAVQGIFFNHRPICCPLILKSIKIAFKERLNLFSDQESNAHDSYDDNMFILFFLTLPQKQFTSITENGERCIVFHDMRKILNTIKNCVFKCLAQEATVSAVTPDLCKTQLLKRLHLKRFYLKRLYLKSEKSVFLNDIDGRKTVKSSVIKNKVVTIGCKRRKITSTIITNYRNKQHNIEKIKYYINKRKNILKSIYCHVASTKRTNLCKDKIVNKMHNSVEKMQESSTNLCTVDKSENRHREQIAVHPCKLKRKLSEFRLSRESLKCIKVINQVNDEFIAAWMAYDDMKILLMIDQHAIHERIRYEQLLLRYNVQNESELLSVNLRDPLSMEFPTETYNLLLRNQMWLRKYGISLGSSKENTILIRTIPQCLVTTSDPCKTEKILPRIYSLLNEVLKNRSITSQANALPLTIHNAIASEACHGAIKFGDKLTLEQCSSLVKLLKHTRFPNRCAHGRPTVIPLMEFSELGKRSARIPEVRIVVVSLQILLRSIKFYRIRKVYRENY
ncbi:PREDICTED: DNA mismatch repair protein MLH3-like isoform X3 [Vollenhovia emeryi]|uniref:DNA mismatch repair protein MLH3-like isoform X3 n=1 Tax=Vollenhovia emeryi TaxID=411798 RepID=UPI0005F441E0|nr:PREDICTED: DNA mismatch repair protein MLH3-like isoform X3 [Vollenhovia emeryi]